jgi:Fe-Mn family superoxide dismutase
MLMSNDVTRRDVMAVLGAGAAVVSLGAVPGAAGAAEAPAAPGAYELPALPYAYDALAPVLEERIVRIHHDRHHAAYVRGLNAALAGLARARAAGDLAPIQALSRELAFHGSGHVLHSLYWLSLRPGAPTEPTGALREAIDRDFGSLELLRAQFTSAAKAVAGSGWATLVFEPLGRRLLVLQIENHEKLTLWGVTPLLVCDVWEHAYYLQYEINRAAYVDAVWRLTDWAGAAPRYAACTR